MRRWLLMAVTLAAAVGSATIWTSPATSQTGPPEWPPNAELEILELTPTSVWLTWPNASGVRDRDAYLVFVASDECNRGDGEANCTPVSSHARRDPFARIPDLDPGVQYNVWVKACNDDVCTLGREDPSEIFTTPRPVGFDLVTPGEMTVVRDDFSSYLIQIDVDPGRNEAPDSVALTQSGLPAIGTTAEFDPAEGEPPFTTTLRIDASRNAPIGQHTVEISATGGGVTRTETVELTIDDDADQEPQGPPVGFDLSAPEEMTVVQDDFASYTIEIDVDPDRNQAPDSVRLSHAGLPSTGTTATFDPAQGEPPFSSTLRIEASANAPAGAHDVRITATGGGETRTQATELRIDERAEDRLDLFGAGREVIIGLFVVALAAGAAWVGRKLWNQRPARH